MVCAVSALVSYGVGELDKTGSTEGHTIWFMEQPWLKSRTPAREVQAGSMDSNQAGGERSPEEGGHGEGVGAGGLEGVLPPGPPLPEATGPL